MRITFTLVLLFLCTPLIAQQGHVVTGQLTDPNDGTPLPGVSVVLKGTSIGTQTDADGRYSLEAPVGSTLVFSFIGLKTREAIVTDKGLEPVNNEDFRNVRKAKRLSSEKFIPPSLYLDTITGPLPDGVAILTNQTPSLSGTGLLDVASIRKIKKHGDRYIIQTYANPGTSAMNLQISSFATLEQCNQLPSLQNRYAQGRPIAGTLQWRGAETQEIFSWGPAIKTLEFDGSNYTYDKNGRLVPAGTGNGNPARNYKTDFFRNGITIGNAIAIKSPGPLRNGTAMFGIDHRNRTGIIPNSRYSRINISSGLRDFKISEKLKANIDGSYNYSTGNLLNRGANLSTLIGGIYRTPSTFDNANGQTIARALRSDNSYKLEDGAIRSHAPALADNPVGLAAELPDTERLHRAMAGLKLTYEPKYNLTFNAELNADHQSTTTIFGLPVGYAGYPDGRLTQRNDRQTVINGSIGESFERDVYSGRLTLNASYDVQHTLRKLERTDGFDFSAGSFNNPEDGNVIEDIQAGLSRTKHKINLGGTYDLHWIVFNLRNQAYFSNTLRTDQYVNIFPSLTISFHLENWIDLWPIQEVEIYGIASRSLREAPLLYSDWSYATSRLAAFHYASFYEANELTFYRSLAPEIDEKLEAGVNLTLDWFRIRLSVYQNSTSDFIAPVFNNSDFQLRNAADVSNTGGFVTAGIEPYNYGMDFRWGADLKWSKYTTEVKRVYGATDIIPLTGFETVQTVLAKGDPLGAIYGTSYVRNESGKLVIDADGFPLEDQTLKKIGNPIPDWTLSLISFTEWKNFRLSFILDYKRGGDVWNGTRAALDYLGRSVETGKLRTTSNYIFYGVDINGNVNTVPVSFADPSLPLSTNRWVRYGWDGVGEKYIEDASWLRLQELSLSYTKRITKRTAFLRELKVMLIARNLLLHTPYSGVDPSSSLFGYNSGTGLDLFNVPGTRSFSLQLTVKL
jgi:CarboxypepD_reg-like domain/TonB dependent receptor